ncbi:MAG: hypothetical protein ABSA53_28140 [Streptosporangiaceae bacterium]
MTWIMVNVPLMVLFVALVAGIPTWLVSKPALAAAPAVRNLPRRSEPSREESGYRRAA